MNILITGGCGFIGSHFVCRALSDGHHIINIDKLTYAGSVSNLDGMDKNPRYVFYQEDITNKEKVSQLVNKHKPDVIVHMAAESHVDRSIDCADAFIETNIVGTYNILDAAFRHSKMHPNFRFIHLSTDEVFGALGEEGFFDETTPYRPNSPYAASKASSDLIVRSYIKTHKFPGIIVNCSNNYGPRQYPEKLIPLTILNALEEKPLPIYGDGKQVRDWLYVEDHVDALFSLIEKGTMGESYCIGGGHELKNIQMVEAICDILDEIRPRLSGESYKSLMTFVKDRPAHDFRYATNTAKVKEAVGWAPKTSFNEGIKKTVMWYLNQGSRLQKESAARSRIGLGERD